MNDFFKTADLCLAATLVTVGFNIQDIDKVNNTKVHFIFRKTLSLDKSVNAFWESTLVVNPQNFFNAIRFLKNRIYSA